MATSAAAVADLPHDSRQAQAFAITFVFPAIATVALFLRLYSRSLTRSFAAGMYLLLVVLFSSSSESTFCTQPSLTRRR